MSQSNLTDQQDEEKRMWVHAQKILLHQKIHTLLQEWDKKRKEDAAQSKSAKDAEDNASNPSRKSISKFGGDGPALWGNKTEPTADD